MTRLSSAPLLVLLAACGGGRFEVHQAPAAPFAGFAAVTVEGFVVDGLDQMTFEKQSKAQNVAAEIADCVRERLKDRNLLQGSGKTLVIRGRIIGLNEGSQALRYFVGFGAGKGEILVETTFNDEAAVLAKGVAKGSVSGGWFGGTTRSASKRVAQAIVDYLEANLK